MTFTIEVKKEIINKQFDDCCLLALCKGFSQYNAKLLLREDKKYLLLSSPIALVIRKLYEFFKRLYKIKMHISTSESANFRKDKIYNLEINCDDDIVLKNFGLKNLLNFKFNDLYDPKWKRHCKRAYLAGLFIASGSINTPKSVYYHLEFQLPTLLAAQKIQKITKEFNLKLKIIQHHKKYVLYLKKVDSISDFLKIIDAFNAVLKLEDIRIYRDMNNSINRLNNIDIHNQHIINLSSLNQIKVINNLKNHKCKNFTFDQLPINVQRICQIRLDNYEASLQELTNIYNRKYNTLITKSAVNHWFIMIRKQAKICF